MTEEQDTTGSYRHEFRDERPLTHDELIERENAPPLEQMPADIARHLQTRRVILSGLKEPIQPEKLKGEASAHYWQLPKEAFFGLPGKTATRLPLHVEKKSFPPEVTFKPHRPRWAAQIYHPREQLRRLGEEGPWSGPASAGVVLGGLSA